MNSPPISVTAHNGMLSQKSHSSIASTMLSGRTENLPLVTPDDVIMPDITPCIIVMSFRSSSIPFVMTIFAIANRINSFSACSGFLTSANEPQVFTTPITKNRTSSAYPIACSAPWILTMTLHIAPPLNCSGDFVSSVHISANFSFQVSSARSRFCTTQLSDNMNTSLRIHSGGVHSVLFHSARTS